MTNKRKIGNAQSDNKNSAEILEMMNNFISIAKQGKSIYIIDAQSTADWAEGIHSMRVHAHKRKYNTFR